MSPSRRPATSADLPELLRIHEATFRPLVEKRFAWDPQEQAKRFGPASLGDVILAPSGEVIGQWIVQEGPGRLFLARVMLAPPWQVS